MAVASTAASGARPGLLVKLRPSRPWRIGPASGERDRVDLIYHSDTLFSAVTDAMRQLGRLEYWLESTARGSGSAEEPLIRFSSLFPFSGETLYVTPPRHIWPPPPSPRVHYPGARFVPMALVESIFAGKPLIDDRWSVDGASECLVTQGRSGPFRIAVRSSAAVDRITGAVEPHSTACLEFAPKSGLWFAVAFADEISRDQWDGPLRAAIRLLADSGFGGERSRGWGRAHTPEFREGKLPQLIYSGTALGATASWLLSVAAPAEMDQVDWSQGNYAVAVRGGRIDSPAGAGQAKKLLNTIEEGSVLHAERFFGAAPDVAPEDFAHPVYHGAWAFTLAVPAEIPRQLETVADEAAEPTPEPASEPAPAPSSETVLQPPSEPQENLPPETSAEDTGHMPHNQPIEIPTTEEELERLEVQNESGPDDDLMPPMNDPGPMEPPFREPQDLTPIDPEPGFENPPGPNPDEPEKPEGPAE